MGQQTGLDTAADGEKLREFMQRQLQDIRALEKMIEDDMIEEGVRRIGAEQEMFLVDRELRPASAAMQMLDRLNDPHFVTEVAQFNLECNLDAFALKGDCLSRMEMQLLGLMEKAYVAGEGIGITPLAGARMKLSVQRVPNTTGKPAARQPRTARGSRPTDHQSVTRSWLASR